MISFIMPVYNVAPALIEEAVNSVLGLAQDIELIVVDDGSTDELTVAAVRALTEKDGRIKVLRQGNAGVATARNRGIREASRPWLSFIDPDDRCRPEMKDVLDVLTDNPNDLVVTAGMGVTVTGEQAERYALAHLSGEMPAIDLLSEMMSLYLYGRESASFILGVPWAKFVRRSHLIERDLYFTDGLVKRSDAEWLIRLYQTVKKVTVLDVPTVDYRLDVPGNISRRFRPEILDAFETLRDTAMGAVVSPAVRELYLLELLKDAINTVFSSPAAPASVASKSAYREFTANFDLSLPLLVSGELRQASISRKLLYVVIKTRSFIPVVLLRARKKVNVAI